MVVGQKYRLIGRLSLDICQKINDLFIKIEVRDFIPFASRHYVGASLSSLTQTIIWVTMALRL